MKGGQIEKCFLVILAFNIWIYFSPKKKEKKKVDLLVLLDPVDQLAVYSIKRGRDSKSLIKLKWGIGITTI